jgi:hypothetical protein
VTRVRRDRHTQVAAPVKDGGLEEPARWRGGGQLAKQGYSKGTSRKPASKGLEAVGATLGFGAIASPLQSFQQGSD